MHATTSLYHVKDFARDPLYADFSALAVPKEVAKHSVGVVVTGGVHTQERMGRSKLACMPDITCTFCGLGTDNVCHHT